ncbi:hypothetical protein SAMN04489712_105292 [Thermomonospora echinospora]|uniref:DUF732 domain-containing protein n=1 Tax=Thermomonospora echinospora TaxID=1992 RepID=A0A1H6AAM2_9ACTN|nr:hypothetical protein [Thermomonospora echinospora]SEG45234.1 hypothetical protein SAMN04489712_105292 [Thermomonospora echinospora]
MSEPTTRHQKAGAIITAGMIVILVVWALAAGRDESAAPPPVDLPLITSPTPSPTETALTALSDRERAFLEEMGEEEPYTSEHKGTLGNGWYACTGDDRDYLAGDEFPDVDGPPTAKILRDNPDESLYEAAITHLCPKYLPLLKKEQKRLEGSFEDGTWEVGEDIKPGTYRTDGGVTDCYWERSTGGGDTIDNNFVTNAPKGVTVTIAPSDGGFTSRDCGLWLRVD